MAATRPPTYRSRTKKPRRRTPKATINPPRPRRPRRAPTAPQPVAPRQPAAPPAPPAPAPVPRLQVRPGPPPETLEGANTRIDAREGYMRTVGNVNQQARELARQFGGAGQVLQFGFDDGRDTQSTIAAVDNDPLSILAQLQRAQETQTRTLGENANEANTFFSGLHLRDRQAITDEVNRQREQARRDYEAAMAELTNQILAARGERDSALRGATATDFAAAASTEPEPEQEAPPPAEAPAPEPTQAPPRPTGREWDGPNVFLQDSGSRKGQWFRVVKRGNKRYRVYANEPNKYIPF